MFPILQHFLVFGHLTVLHYLKPHLKSAAWILLSFITVFRLCTMKLSMIAWTETLGVSATVRGRLSLVSTNVTQKKQLTETAKLQSDRPTDQVSDSTEKLSTNHHAQNTTVCKNRWARKHNLECRSRGTWWGTRPLFLCKGNNLVANTQM